MTLTLTLTFIPNPNAIPDWKETEREIRRAERQVVSYQPAPRREPKPQPKPQPVYRPPPPPKRTYERIEPYQPPPPPRPVKRRKKVVQVKVATASGGPKGRPTIINRSHPRACEGMTIRMCNILAIVAVEQRDGQSCYCLRWSDGRHTWQPETKLECPRLLAAFNELGDEEKKQMATTVPDVVPSGSLDTITPPPGKPRPLMARVSEPGSGSPAGASGGMRYPGAPAEGDGGGDEEWGEEEAMFEEEPEEVYPTPA